MSYKLFWNPSSTPKELHSMISTLQQNYPIVQTDNNNAVEFRKVAKEGHLKVTDTLIEYNSVSNAARGLGIALSGLDTDETTCFSTLGIMLDCSRNAVMTVPYFKKWLRQLALMGYNMAMLYTEDTYKLPDEPYFGYMRGVYTIEEIKQIDDYADSLGIEIIPCIQVLGHLEQILHWQAYDKVKDTSSVLIVDADETYALIGKMLNFWSEAVRSKRVHIGMDETHDLGRGRFMDKFGYERGFELFNRHLLKVNDMCKEQNLKPMIWSDMYFRMGNENYDYYAKDTVIPNDVKKAIPENMELVYWDYYHDDKEFYTEWIERHRDLGFEPIMGSGVWTWSKFWYDHSKTVATVKPCIEACQDTGVKELFFTMWGDDGACCEMDSTLAGLCWCSEFAFAGTCDDNRLQQQLSAICDYDYRAQIEASKLEQLFGSFCLAWDDPLMGKWYNEYAVKAPKKLEILEKNCDEIISTLSCETGNIEFAVKLAELYSLKLNFRKNLLYAYEERDVKLLSELKDISIPKLISIYKAFSILFRAQWMEKFKPQGLEFVQTRFAGQIARLEETVMRIDELLLQTVDSIPELEDIYTITGDAPFSGSYSQWAYSCVCRW